MLKRLTLVLVLVLVSVIGYSQTPDKLEKTIQELAGRLDNVSSKGDERFSKNGADNLKIERILFDKEGKEVKIPIAILDAGKIYSARIAINQDLEKLNNPEWVEENRLAQVEELTKVKARVDSMIEVLEGNEK